MIKFNDEDYKKNLVDFLNKIFRVVNNDNNFNFSELFKEFNFCVLKYIDLYSFELAKKMFLIYKYDNFKT